MVRGMYMWTAMVLGQCGAAATCEAEQRVLHAPMSHLRSGETREWTSFPETASGRDLRIRFQAVKNDSPHTLGLRRVDVKHGWQVLLNGKRLGRLFSDENDMEEVWELPPGALRDGENELVVEPTDARGDDVYIGRVWLDPRPRAAVFGEASVHLAARDAKGDPIPCRFTIIDSQGSLAALGSESNDTLAVRSGVVYTSTGAASVGLAAGEYTILCGRGFEYDLPQRKLTVASGDQANLTFELHRVVDTAGLVACDTHVHTFEVSRHGDASLVERMITLAGEGVELAIATDHNVFVDYAKLLKSTGVHKHLTPLIGNEVTTAYGHFNVFPAESSTTPLPDHRAATWEALFKSIYSTPNLRVAILNHPRDVHSGFTPFGPENRIAAVGARLDDRNLQANAIELINSAALQSDPMVLFHDWLTELNRGASLTAIGSSDSHEVSRKIVGQGRSYVAVNDEDPGSIDTVEAVDSFVKGRVRVSLGLLTELIVNEKIVSGGMAVGEGDSIDVRVRVQGPGWVHADEVVLYANGRRVRSQSIPHREGAAAGVKADVRWQLPKPSHDIYLVALARGPGVTGLHWPIAKAYQPTSKDWRPYVFGCSGVVRVDVDADNHWTPARVYAEDAVKDAEGDFSKLLKSLRAFDSPTAAFAAHAWSESGGTLGESVQTMLRKAPDHVQAGFREYAQSLRASLEARSKR